MIRCRKPCERRSAALAVLFCLTIVSQAAAQSRPADDVDERAAIQRLISQPEPSDPGADHLARMLAEADAHAYLIERIDRFLALHPRDPAAESFTLAKLRSIYLLSTLRGQDFARLAAEVSRIRSDTPFKAVREEADRIHLRLQLAEMASARRTGRPDAATSAPTAVADDEIVRQYVVDHAQEGSTVPMLERLVERSFDRGDTAAEPWLGMLRTHHPNHVATIALLGRQRLMNAIGKPWRPSLRSVDGTAIDWTRYSGKPVVVAFWSSKHRPSLDLLQRLHRIEQRQPDMRVLTIAIDTDTEAVRGRLADLGLSWPTACDALGWEAPVAIEYGIRTLPAVFLLDPGGILRSVFGGIQPIELNRIEERVSRLYGPPASNPASQPTDAAGPSSTRASTTATSRTTGSASN